jgi:hypothetical protein
MNKPGPSWEEVQRAWEDSRKAWFKHTGYIAGIDAILDMLKVKLVECFQRMPADQYARNYVTMVLGPFSECGLDGHIPLIWDNRIDLYKSMAAIGSSGSRRLSFSLVRTTSSPYPVAIHIKYCGVQGGLEYGLEAREWQAHSKLALAQLLSAVSEGTFENTAKMLPKHLREFHG